MFPFELPGLGISRSTLDDVAARGARVEQGCAVHEVTREDRGFGVDGMACSVVIDAAGKVGRVTKGDKGRGFGDPKIWPGTPKAGFYFSFFEKGFWGGGAVVGGRLPYSF